MSQINVTTIRNRTGGAPNLDQGVVVGAAATFSGNVSVSGVSTHVGNAYFADGVNVGGTGAANKLEDYEEGTFTPEFSTFSSSSTVSYTTQTGRYTKVGDTIHYYLQIVCTVSSWGTGTWKITGLPFVHWSGYNNPPTMASKTVWREAGGTYVYKDQQKDYRWDAWWNQSQIFAVDTSNEGEWRPTTATDLQSLTFTVHSVYFTN